MRKKIFESFYFLNFSLYVTKKFFFSFFHSTYCFSFFQDTLDAVENLIKKHEAFEKSAATQEERFAALEKLTTVCLFVCLLCAGWG